MGRLTRLLTAEVQAGVLTVNEARARLGLKPWDFGEDHPRRA